MSAWPIPDEVVEALARLRCPADEACPDCIGIARAFLESYRLVVLPEEPTEWEFEEYDAAGVARWSDCALRGTAMALSVDPDSTGRYRPVRSIRIPGQPITVDKEESDGE